MFNQTVMLNSKTDGNPLLPSFDSAAINKQEKALMSKTSALGKLTKNYNNNPDNPKQSSKTIKSRNNSSGTKLMKASSVESSAKRERVQSVKTIKSGGGSAS